MSKKGFTYMDLKDAPFMSSRPGLRSKRMCGDFTPTNSLMSGFLVLDPGAKIPVHFHTVEELQYIVYGYGVIRDGAMQEYPARPGIILYCPPGAEGAHGFENTGDLPMSLIWVYPTLTSPQTTWIEK